MSAQDNGGPAFPGAGPAHPQPTGMTLRDYFAAQAMIRLTGADPDGIHSAAMLATLSYRLADAMLAERAKP